jgi:hypothetical protein
MKTKNEPTIEGKCLACFDEGVINGNEPCPICSKENKSWQERFDKKFKFSFGTLDREKEVKQFISQVETEAIKERDQYYEEIIDKLIEDKPFDERDARADEREKILEEIEKELLKEPKILYSEYISVENIEKYFQKLKS